MFQNDLKNLLFSVVVLLYIVIFQEVNLCASVKGCII